MGPRTTIRELASWKAGGVFCIALLSGCARSGSESSSEVASLSPVMAQSASQSFVTQPPIEAGRPAQTTSVPLVGKVRYQRVPFGREDRSGLDYSQQVFEASRGIELEIIELDAQAQVARATTLEDGSFAVNVPSGVALMIRAQALMRHAGVPSWHFEVRNIDASATPFSYTSAPFIVAASGGRADLDIPSGWSSSGTLIGERSAAPFAILDTVLRAKRLVHAADASAAFLPLVVDWSPDHDETFYQRMEVSFDPQSGDTEIESYGRIRLSGKIDHDTSEYDAHVIAHEFGHYLEDVFVRSDTLGGSHTGSHALDIRNAFSEGFATTFACIVLGDPRYRDSSGRAQRASWEIDIESPFVERFGWYDEYSIAQLLWDLYDERVESADNVNLGFAPLWRAATSLRDSPAYVSIFSFVAALNEQQSAMRAAIDQVVAARSISVDSLDAFASDERHDAGREEILPIYAPIAVDGPSVTVLSTPLFRNEPIDSHLPANALGVRRFLKLELQHPRRLRVKGIADISGRDVRLRLLRRGRPTALTVDGRFDELELPEGWAAPGTYIIEVLDADNAGLRMSPEIARPVWITVTVTSY